MDLLDEVRTDMHGRYQEGCTSSSTPPDWIREGTSPGVGAAIHADSKVNTARQQQPLHDICKEDAQGGCNAALADESIRQIGLAGILPYAWMIYNRALWNVGTTKSREPEALPCEQERFDCLQPGFPAWSSYQLTVDAL